MRSAKWLSKYSICFCNTNTFVSASIIRKGSAYKPSWAYQQSLFWAYSHRSSPSPALSHSVEMETGTRWQFSSSYTVHFSLSLYLDQKKCGPEGNRGRGRFKPSHTASCICTSGWGVRLVYGDHGTTDSTSCRTAWLLLSAFRGISIVYHTAAKSICNVSSVTGHRKWI